MIRMDLDPASEILAEAEGLLGDKQ